MKRLTIVVIPERGNKSRQFTVPSVLFKVLPLAVVGVAALLGYFVLDYRELQKIRAGYEATVNENESLRGEAKILLSNLEDVKQSLRKVQDYTAQLTDLTTHKVQKVRKETGIGPLSVEESSVLKAQAAQQAQNAPTSPSYLPLGVNLDKLTFRPVFDRLTHLGSLASQNALELQYILSNLSQQKSLLASIPSEQPVNGWITSGFGARISPFTGSKAYHMGIDIAANTGTPVLAPADGVVIFAGAKEGFGNFVMIAHGYGIVSHYGHNAEILVQPGQKVHRGDQVATVGMTGRTTGPHVHYEVWVNGNAVDPRKFLLNASDVELAAH